MKEQPKFTPEEIQELSMGLTRQPPVQEKKHKSIGRNVSFTESEFEAATNSAESKNNISNFDQEKSADSSQIILISNLQQFAKKYSIDLNSITYSEAVTKISDPHIKNLLIQRTSTGSGQDITTALEGIYSSKYFTSIEKRKIDFSVKKAISEIDSKNKAKILRGF